MANIETPKQDESLVLADLVTTVAAQGDRETSLEALVGGLAERIKATSNDQNIQRLARALRAATPRLVESIAGKDARPAH